MYEVDYIKNELSRLENDNEHTEKYLSISAFSNSKSRKIQKTLLKQELNKLGDIKVEISKAKNVLSNVLIQSNKILSEKDASEEVKKEARDKILETNSLLEELKKIEQRACEREIKINKLLKPIIRYELNKDITISFVGVMFFLIIYGYGVKFFNPQRSIPYLIANIIILTLFFFWKLYYWLYYCKQIEATSQMYIITLSLKLTNVLLLMYIPYYSLCYCLNLAEVFSVIPLVVIISFKVGIFIYDLFLTSNLFDTIDNTIALFISGLLVFVLIAIGINNQLFLLISKILMVAISILLTTLMLKKCLLDEISLKGVLPIVYFVMLLFLTILISCLTIYLITWDKSNMEQPLYESVMGVYAAVVGGAITLGGVAWTIKEGNRKRKEELERVENERKEEERKKLVPYTKLEILLKETSFVETFIEQQVKFDNEQKLSKIENNTCYLINIANFKIRNISNSNYILHGISIDGMVFKFKNQSILSSNEVCKVATTRNTPIVFAKPIEKISLLLTDILANKYELMCEFKNEIEDLPCEQTTLKNKKYTLWRYTYFIENVSLPNLIE